jgi:hypothetical protein
VTNFFFAQDIWGPKVFVNRGILFAGSPAPAIFAGFFTEVKWKSATDSVASTRFAADHLALMYADFAACQVFPKTDDASDVSIV